MSGEKCKKDVILILEQSLQKLAHAALGVF